MLKQFVVIFATVATVLALVGRNIWGGDEWWVGTLIVGGYAFIASVLVVGSLWLIRRYFPSGKGKNESRKELVAPWVGEKDLLYFRDILVGSFLLASVGLRVLLRIVWFSAAAPMLAIATIGGMILYALLGYGILTHKRRNYQWLVFFLTLNAVTTAAGFIMVVPKAGLIGGLPFLFQLFFFVVPLLWIIKTKFLAKWKLIAVGSLLAVVLLESILAVAISIYRA